MEMPVTSHNTGLACKTFLLDSGTISLGTKWTCHSEGQRLSPRLPGSQQLALPTSPPSSVRSPCSRMLPDSSMASLRSRRRSCIRAAFSATSTRAGFQKRQRNTHHRLKFLDPYASLEDTPARLACSFRDCSPGNMTCHRPWHAPTSRSPVHSGGPPSAEAPALLVRATGGAPASLGDSDVDMQLEEMTEEDWGPLPPAVELPETGRQAQGRARAARPPPRLGSERDKGPKLSLSKRKLELLLSEPEKRKRKKQYVT